MSMPTPTIGEPSEPAALTDSCHPREFRPTSAGRRSTVGTREPRVTSLRYLLNLYSPETYDIFSNSQRTITGFRERQRKQANGVLPGDRLLCYMTTFSRWVGVLEVEEGPLTGQRFRFYKGDPFSVQFRVRPLIWLPREKTIPIREDHVWNRLSFTRKHRKGSTTWTGPIRNSLREFDGRDGGLLEDVLGRQTQNGIEYPFDEKRYRRLISRAARLRKGGKDQPIPRPEPVPRPDPKPDPVPRLRTSIKTQAQLAQLGSKMGFLIWIPQGDRGRVEEAITQESDVSFLDTLPLHYNHKTLKTIERIDVLWIRGNSIVRAFEVEHTTAVYSGILRMSDLLALQPNMDIRLHIVAPSDRREKVLAEIGRPTFAALGGRPLAERCTYLSYDSVSQIMALPHLDHCLPSIVD